MLADIKLENSEASLRPLLSSQTADVPNRPFYSYKEASPSRSAPYEADSVSHKNHWRIPESFQLHLKWWLQEANILQSQPLHSCSTNL